MEVNCFMNLSDCRDRWIYNQKYDCWYLENLVYTQKAVMPEFQRLSIFVPKAYLNADGTVRETGRVGPFTARTVPVVFENNASGYRQMPNTWLDGPRCCAGQYLEQGLVYVTCGCRGKDSVDAGGHMVGKSPATLVDFKTALRFLRHNRAALPGDWEKVISVGWSAGGAMSALLGVSGDHPAFDSYLKENGAFLEESDSVFAAQIYCPIIDLEHADMAYEWMFRADKTSEDSHSGPAETMTPFKEAVSQELFDQYITYFNSLNLRDPATGEALILNPDGRSGAAYDYLMSCLDASATDYLTRLAQGKLPVSYTAQDYLSGSYTYEEPVRKVRPAGANPPESSADDVPSKRVRLPAEQSATVTKQGKRKQDWLQWDGSLAHVADLDTYVLRHRRRMKPCTSFDSFGMQSAENQVLGDENHDYTHFSPSVALALEALKERFPEECAQYNKAYASVIGDTVLAERCRMINPYTYIGTKAVCRQAKHYRIRVGAHDADTSFMVSLVLALKLSNAGFDSVDYALVWDQPHSEADYPGEICDWIKAVCK